MTRVIVCQKLFPVTVARVPARRRRGGREARKGWRRDEGMARAGCRRKVKWGQIGRERGWSHSYVDGKMLNSHHFTGGERREARRGGKLTHFKIHSTAPPASTFVW